MKHLGSCHGLPTYPNGTSGWISVHDGYSGGDGGGGGENGGKVGGGDGGGGLGDNVGQRRRSSKQTVPPDGCA